MTTARSWERSNSRCWELSVGLRSDRVDHRVVQLGQLVVAHVSADLHVPEEAEARPCGDLLEGARHSLQLWVVRRDTEPDEPPWGGQPLDHVDLDDWILAREQRGGCVERGRPGAHNCDSAAV